MLNGRHEHVTLTWGIKGKTSKRNTLRGDIKRRHQKETLKGDIKRKTPKGDIKGRY